MSKKNKIQLAREFRKNPTKSEKILWEAIRNRKFLNLKFRRQHLISGFIIDFYCNELQLAIEIDGSIHKYEDQMNKDIERQRIIEEEGIIFIRLTGKEVEYNVYITLKKLKNLIEVKNTEFR